ncbi:MAG: hypothetical protein OEZ37_12620, partial [Gemmatimonadota bacterium]|nr:hypothetical protein [Gemmatimonadota bacterium]
MTRDPAHLTEEEANRLWQRAAQLQAEAARRSEALAITEGTAELDEEMRTGVPDGYALEHVRAAALEAGIGGTYVEEALADLLADRVATPRLRRSQRIARRMLGDPPPTVTARRVIRADAGEVLRAMEAVLPAAPYHLVLRDRHGDPAQGGAMVFDIPDAGFAGAGKGGFAGHASFADLRQVYVNLREVDAGTCELTVRGPVAWAYPLNAGFSLVFTGMGTGLGLAAGSGVAALVGAGGAALGIGVGLTFPAALLFVAAGG